jgi:hypothetical protein
VQNVLNLRSFLDIKVGISNRLLNLWVWNSKAVFGVICINLKDISICLLEVTV